MVLRSSIPACLGLALLLATPVLAQDATASGVVTEQGRPIAGAAVLVGDAEPVLTDQDGRFTAPADAGEHKIRVALHGYQPVERTVTFEVDKVVLADFALEPVLQVQSLTVPASLKQGAEGQAQLMVKNNATSTYAIQTAGLSFLGADGKDRSGDFAVTAAEANPATIEAGQTASLNFAVTPAAGAATGNVTVRASLFAFDTALGENLLTNSSLQEVDEAGTPTDWAFGIDNSALGIEAEGAIVTSTTITGPHSAEIRVTTSPEGQDVRAYWGVGPWIAVEAGKTYTLSGYVKTQDIEPTEGHGAAVYVPVVGDSPYQQPNAPWITGTRDWRKAIIVFSVSPDAENPQAVPRGEIQRATGTAWFDNFSLTEGTADGSLTLTGGDQTLEVTGA